MLTQLTKRIKLWRKWSMHSKIYPPDANPGENTVYDTSQSHLGRREYELEEHVGMD